MKFNPYIAGNPVGGSEAFIGRKGVYQDVLRVLKSPNENGIVLYGQRRIGKTSVLLELAKSLPDNGLFFSVYFDLQDKAALSLNEVLKQLAEKILYDLNIPASDKMNDDFENEFKKVFLPYLLSQLPENSVFVILLDEFDVLSNSSKEKAGSTLFPYLRDLMAENLERINFIFVVGRRIEDLSSEFLSLFKGVKSRRVSLLSCEDAEALVRLSERNESLKWEDDSVAKVQALAGGHPFLTQQLCQSIWENMYDDDPENAPVVKANNVSDAVPETLKSATNSLEWLWDGLGPAERVVASAIAEAGAKVITQGELEKLLQESGIRILIGELQDAPRVLKGWDIIQPENGGYRFQVEMLRRWIVQKKPLARVQDEIDRIKPVAESLFQAAYGFYQAGPVERVNSPASAVG